MGAMAGLVLVDATVNGLADGRVVLVLDDSGLVLSAVDSIVGCMMGVCRLFEELWRVLLD